MYKIITIGVALAVLGIGGIAILSKTPTRKDVGAASEVVNANLVATTQEESVAVVAAPLGGPFERSAAICATGKYMCITFNGRVDGRTDPVTVLDMIPGINSWERVKMLNGWSETEVTLETVVPIGTTIAFNERPSE